VRYLIVNSVGALAVFCTVGCENGDLEPDPCPEPGLVRTVSIDPDASVSAVLDSSTQISVEYSGGNWTIESTCGVSAGCFFDLGVTTYSEADTILPLSITKTPAFESDDSVQVFGDGTARFSMNVGGDSDAVIVVAEPGAALYISFHQSCDRRYVAWIGEGIAHKGAPTNPTRFRPAVDSMIDAGAD
jgi:hypothetical protein